MPTRDVTCEVCKARVFIGEYEDPARGDVILAEWIARHNHEKNGDLYETMARKMHFGWLSEAKSAATPSPFPVRAS